MERGGFARAAWRHGWQLRAAAGICALFASAMTAAPVELVLRLSADGDIVGGDQETLHDHAEPDGHLPLRAWLAGATGDDVDETRRVRVEAEAEAPFEGVQAILGCCAHDSVEIEEVVLAVEGLSGGRAVELAGLERGEETTLRVEVTDEPERALAFVVLGSPDESFDAMDEAAAAAAQAARDVILVVEPARDARCDEVGELLRVLDEAGVVEVAVSPVGRPVYERVAERWGAITEDDWIAAYEFMAPEARETEKLSGFLLGKENHEYRDLDELRVLAVAGDTAHVYLEVDWTPRHPELADRDPDELRQHLEICETWREIDGEWYWLSTVRPKEFVEEHPELEGELDG